MSQNLLVTKLNTPPTRKNLVPRPRLIEMLCDPRQAERKLTLVSAPAGYGKTTLVTEWLRGLQTQSTWLSLDESDNDPGRFLAYLIAALQNIDPHIGHAAQAMMQSPQPLPPEALLTSLINDVATSSQPCALVLDDYHVIQTLQVHQQLGFLVERQPPQLHVVLLTREDPPLPLARLRGRGHMLEIRQEHLRFSQGECGQFLQQVMGLDLSPSEIAALERRTEGWIAGLQLAALSMRGHEDASVLIQALTGSNRYILDYLVDEVFIHQSTEVQEFLLKTSILHQMCGPLCDAVIEKTNSQELLEVLEQSNMFIVPLDQSCIWYRYHRLFADLLYHRLKISKYRNAISQLQSKASQWYESNGYIVDAITYALAAEDWEGVTPLLIRSSKIMLERSEIATFLEWHQRLPEKVILANPTLCINYAWALALTGQHITAINYLQNLEEIAPGNPELMGQVMVARAYIAREQGDIAIAIDLSERALSQLAEENLQQRGLVAMNLGILRWNIGELKSAEEALSEASLAGEATETTNIHLTALSFLGRIQSARGKLHQAESFYRQVIGDEMYPAPASALAYIDLAALQFEWNALEKANSLVSTGIELSRRSGNLPVLILGNQVKARTLQALGDNRGAEEAIDEAHQLVDKPGVPPTMRFGNAACEAELAMVRGETNQAVKFLNTLSQAPITNTNSLLPHIVLARVLMATGYSEDARANLEQIAENAHNAELLRDLLIIRILQSLAAPSFNTALPPLIDALVYGQDEGFVRTFIEQGEPLAVLLKKIENPLSLGIRPSYLQTLLESMAYQHKSREHPLSYEKQQGIIEPLSERELEVLAILANHRTNQEIAQSLFVSINTVKAHLKNIYGKLGVTNRRAAIAKAREKGIID